MFVCIETECKEEALGMNNNLIRNSAISASTFEPDSPPSSGRIYSPGGWRALSHDLNPYLEVGIKNIKMM